MLAYLNRSNLPVVSSYSGTLIQTREELERLALQIRRDIIEITYYSGTQSSHVGGELSCADILAVIYGSFLGVQPENPDWPERDIFIMSKGHCSAALYSAMAWRGFFPREKLWNEFNQVTGTLQEHCNLYLPGIEATTGSLGMGLANACGYAWTAKHLRQRKQVYCVLGDGECTEGQTWESIGLASQLALDNLIAFVDFNKYIISSTTSEVVNLEPFEKRLQAFGWDTRRIDGHDVLAIRNAVMETQQGHLEKPHMIICDTIKGKGISFIEKDAIHWHAGHLDEMLRQQCLDELMGDKKE